MRMWPSYQPSWLRPWGSRLRPQGSRPRPMGTGPTPGEQAPPSESGGGPQKAGGGEPRITDGLANDLNGLLDLVLLDDKRRQNLMMSPWVGLARSPLSRRRRRTFQASESLVSRVTMAFSSPFPRTAVTMSEGSFLSSFSSSKTSRGAMAPWLPRCLPQYVKPSSGAGCSA